MTLLQRLLVLIFMTAAPSAVYAQEQGRIVLSLDYVEKHQAEFCEAVSRLPHCVFTFEEQSDGTIILTEDPELPPINPWQGADHLIGLTELEDPDRVRVFQGFQALRDYLEGRPI